MFIQLIKVRRNVESEESYSKFIECRSAIELYEEHLDRRRPGKFRASFYMRSKVV